MIDSAERYGDGFGAERMWGLKELPLPEGIGWLPPAPGWYVIAALVLIVFGVACWRRWRRWQRNAYRRSAIRQVATLSGLTSSSALPQILRSVALQSFRRTDVASLRGEGWIDWLNNSAGTELFQLEDARFLDTLAYSRGPLDADQLACLKVATIRWLKQHHADV